MSLKERKKVLINSLIVGFIIIGIIATVFTIGKVTADTEDISEHDYIAIQYTEEIIVCEICNSDCYVEIIWPDCTTNARKTIKCENQECSNFGVRVTCEENVDEAMGHDISYTSDETTHIEQCYRCDYTVTEEHKEELKGYEETETGHRVIYECVCGVETVDVHEGDFFDNEVYSWTDNGDGTHKGECKSCEYTKENESHSGATHVSGGKCTKCLAVYQEGHEDVIKKYEYKDEDSHIVVYGCALGDKCDPANYQFANIGESHNIEWTVNEDGTHTGTCSLCKEIVIANEAHTMRDWTIDSEDETKHTRSCTTGCGYTETEAHSSNVKDNGDGTHTLRCVKGCGYSGVTVAHYKGDNPTLVEYQDVTSEDGKITGHKVIYECAELGCTGKVEEEHVTVWTNNEDETHTGTCETCGYIKENIEHSGATHANGGKCEYCGARYETHEKNGEATYEVLETGHKATYSCSFENCEEKIEETEEHSGANHANGGICEKCEAQYETHEKTGEPEGYNSTETVHTAIYKCSVAGCTVKIKEEHTTKWTAVEGSNTHNATCEIENCGFTEEEEEHTMGAWTIDSEDEAKHTRTCSKCGYKETKDHEKGEATYEETETGHKVTYACSVEGCTGKIEEDHETIWRPNDDKTTHTGTCESCEYTKENQEHTWTVIKGEGYDSSGHLRECNICKSKQQSNHNNIIVDNGKTHTLRCMDNCGYEEEEEHYKKENATPVEYKDSEDGKHIAVYQCAERGCTGKVEEEHETVYIDNEDGTHSETCNTCGYTKEKVDHSGATHENGGKCEYCEVQYEKHEKKEDAEPIEYKEGANGGHIAVYECGAEGCAEKIEDTEENHSGATHANGGICEKCEKQYEEHVKKGHPTFVSENTKHKLIYACAFNGCEEDIVEEHETRWIQNSDDNTKHIGTCITEQGCNFNEEEAHTMGEWTIDAEDETKHTSTCKCGYKDSQVHEKGEATYEETEEGHKVIYACSIEGCTGKITENHETKWIATEDRASHTGTCEVTDCGYEKEAQPHSGGTHENNGLCEKCDIGYQIHEKTGNPTYEVTENGHKAVYACSFDGCTEKIKDDEEEHTGATHTNGGKCEKCEEAYEVHTKTGNPTYEVTENGHKAIYDCSFEGCTGKIEETENHTGATHANGGVCEKCEEVYETHEKTGEPTYEVTENGHKAVYDCSFEGCTEKIKDEEENHTGATHANGGKCEKCEEVYEAHEKTGEATYEVTENGHKAIYDCSFEGCTGKIEETENHSGATHANDGKCEKCEEVYETHEKTGNPTYEVTETGHKAVYDCSAEGCTEKIKDDEENHTGATHVNGGKCEKCEEVYEVHEKTGEATYEKTETGHKAIYACSFEGCTGKIEELGAHSVSDWEDDESGTHSGTCSICKFSVTENHTNGTTSNCTKCDYTVNNTEDDEDDNGGTNEGDGDTDNENNGNTDDEEDEGNTNEGDENTGNDNDEGTNGGNSNNGNGNNNGGTTNNNSGLKDETQATSPIPQTGVNSIIIISSIVALIGLAVTMTIKLKGYKDVK